MLSLEWISVGFVHYRGCEIFSDDEYMLKEEGEKKRREWKKENKRERETKQTQREREGENEEICVYMRRSTT